MKKKDRNLLLAGGAAAGGFYLYQRSRRPQPPAVSGLPPAIGNDVDMIGAIVPDKPFVPQALRGKCSPLALDVALWGSVGALGYHFLGGRGGGRRRRR